MKKILLLGATSLFALLSLSPSKAQTPLEKTYDVSGKAKRGFLGGVEVNKEKGTFDLVYLTPTFFTGAGNAGSSFDADVPVEIYSYDKELNMINSEKTKVSPKKYSWFDYRGLYSFEMVKCMVGLGGLSFQKVNRQYLYNPQTGTYSINKEKVLDKEKPKSADGNKYSFYTVTSYDMPFEGSSLAIAGKKIEKSDATKENKLHLFNHMMDYDVLRCDKSLNVTVTDALSFKCMNTVLYSGQIKDDRTASNDDLPRDWVLVYVGTYTGQKNAPFQAENPTTLTYVRINTSGKIVDKITFDSPANAWGIEGVYEKNNTVYMYGMAIQKDREKKSYGDLTGSAGFSEATFTHYQIGKISGGKFDYLKCYPLSEIQSKQSKPAGQKGVEIDGKYTTTTQVTLLSNGDFLVTCQKYEKEKEPKWSNEFKNYKNMLMFVFDNAGNLKKNYGLNINSNQGKTKAGFDAVFGKPAQNYFFPSGDGKSLYWFIVSAKDGACSQTRCDENFCDFHCWPLLGVEYCSMNMETGELSDLKTFGNDKKNPFYVFGITKPVQIDNHIFFFSEDEDKKGNGGDNLRLTRIDISK